MEQLDQQSGVSIVLLAAVLSLTTACNDDVKAVLSEVEAMQARVDADPDNVKQIDELRALCRKAAGMSDIHPNEALDAKLCVAKTTRSLGLKGEVSPEHVEMVNREVLEALSKRIDEYLDPYGFIYMAQGKGDDEKVKNLKQTALKLLYKKRDLLRVIGVRVENEQMGAVGYDISRLERELGVETSQAQAVSVAARVSEVAETAPDVVVVQPARPIVEEEGVVDLEQIKESFHDLFPGDKKQAWALYVQNPEIGKDERVQKRLKHLANTVLKMWMREKKFILPKLRKEEELAALNERELRKVLRMVEVEGSGLEDYAPALRKVLAAKSAPSE